jgi:ATP-dependent helicase/nuclease subunit A
MSSFTIYSSSAGSGKTFTLTKEYLKLVLQREDPLYFRSILAMTFTNEAAGQMKERIIKGLKGIASGATTEEKLFNAIKKELAAVEEEILRQRASTVLYHILQNYGDFAIKTIDSFVNQIISSFTFDLKLPYNYEIVLDTNLLITEAVGNLIDKVGGDDEELTAMFTDFAQDKVEENLSWNSLTAEIVKFAAVIFENNNAEQIEQNSELLHSDLVRIRAQIKNFMQEQHKKATLLLEQLGTLLSRYSDDPFHGKSKGIYGALTKLVKDPKSLWSFEPSKSVQKVLDSGEWTKKPLPDLEAMQALTHEILDLKSEKWEILEKIYKGILKLPFLTVIKAEIDSLLAERNEAVLADFNRKILKIVENEPVPYIYERIGEKYNHLLIDEFQDTADIQFFNLLPLLENGISKKNNSLIVGDPKQAIYSWRGGNVLLMIDLIAESTLHIEKEPNTAQEDSDVLPEAVFPPVNYLDKHISKNQINQLKLLRTASSTRSLKTNYRSRPGIVRFNNAFFEHLLTTKNSPLIRQVFNDYRQQVQDENAIGGYVEIEEISKDEVAEKLVALVEELLTEGYALNDICVLNRANSEGKICAEALSKKGYPIRTEEALLVNSAREVKFLISALRFHLHPERAFERFEFFEFYLLLTENETREHDIQAISNLDPVAFRQYFQDLGVSLVGMDGLDVYQMAEFLVARFSLLEKGKNLPYIFAFLDYVLQYTTTKSRSLSDFLRDWQTKSEKLSLSAPPGDAITINTIHKAKGLEYPVVILPHLGFSTKAKNDSKVWLNVEALDYPELKVETRSLKAFPFSYSDKFSFSKETLTHMEELILIENLNLLYVALTRAEQRQYVWITSSKANTVGLWLKEFADPLFGPEGKFVFGEKGEVKSRQEEVQNVSYVNTFPPAFREDRKLEINWKPRGEEIQMGNLFHDAMQRIRYAEDIPKVLQQMGHPEGLAEQLQELVQHPELKDLYAKPAHIKNETTILSSHAQSRRPDRVVFFQNKTYIIDYKTGKKSNSHGLQLKEYAKLLRQMGYQDIVLYLVYLQPIEVIKVV